MSGRFAKRILWNKANADRANEPFRDLFKDAGGIEKIVAWAEEKSNDAQTPV